MTKLHEVFLRKEPNFDHGQAIKELIEKEGIDINARDEDGNTILHLMAKYINQNYHNPYFRKDNPEGKFINYSGYSGYYYLAFNNYQGPDFFDDLELLLALGANPNLKNNHDETAFYLLFKHGYAYLDISSIDRYFTLIQKYFPHAVSLIEIFQLTNYFTNPKFFEQRYKEGFNKGYPKSWIEQSLLDNLDERLLPLDCLEQLVKWVDEGQLKALDTSDHVVTELRQRLVKQIAYQQDFPNIIDATVKLIQCYQKHKDIIIRGMLINSLECPLNGLLEQLNNLNREIILTEELNNELNTIFLNYNQTKEMCEALNLMPISLTAAENLILKSVCESLDGALNDQLYQRAYQSFDQKSDFAKEFMLSRFRLFQKHNEHAQTVKTELEQLFQPSQP